MSDSRMKKSAFAVPGPALAIEIDPATLWMPVCVVGSWAIGGSSLRASVVMPFMLDLLTGAVYVRKTGKGGAALRVGMLSEKVPALTRYVRDLVSLENEDEVELLEVTTERIAVRADELDQPAAGL